MFNPTEIITRAAASEVVATMTALRLMGVRRPPRGAWAMLRPAVMAGMFVSAMCAEAVFAGSGPLFPDPLCVVGEQPRSVAITDLNGDGNADLAVANFNDDTISIVLQQSDGTFAHHVTYAVGDGPVSIAIDDLDGDGDADLAVANYKADNISTLRNNGDGTFADHLTYDAGNGPSSVVIDDLDGDGDADLAVINTVHDYRVSTYLNHGDGTFADQVTYDAGHSAFGVAIGDLDGDGDADLAVTNFHDEEVSILLNFGNGAFADRVTYAVGDHPNSVAIDDLDGDGDADLAVTNLRDDDLSILLNLGNGVFELDIVYAVGDGPSAVEIGDLDGDGDADLAVASSASDNVSILLSHGDGTFAPHVAYGVSDGPCSIAIDDLDGDGDADLAVANRYNRSVSILLNHGDATFPPKATYGVGNQPVSIAIADLDGDGDADLAVANSGDDNVSILMNPGDGTFGDEGTYAVGIHPTSIATSDLDDDGDADLAVATWVDQVSILLNHGDGTFADQVTYAVGYNPSSVAVSDLDGDDDADLAVANDNSNSVSVLLNHGDGTFAPQVTYRVGHDPACVAIADLDRDGDADLAVANANHHTISILPNHGDGTFADEVTYYTERQPNSIAIGDMEGDGDADLAVTMFSDSIAILVNDGDGTFPDTVTYVVGGVPTSVAMDDLDRDGYIDVAVVAASYWGGRVVTRLNNGDGTLADRAAYGAGEDPSSVTIGDLNGDGVPDLAVVNGNDDTVSILLNQSVPDCNLNSIPDRCDLDCGSPGGECDVPGCGLSADCDTNEIPDECQPDCNTNQIADYCEGRDGLCPDCQDNLVPDECDPDCDGDSRPDDCEESPAEQDCDLNGVCNGEEIAACPPEDLSCADCNTNLVPDACDLAEDSLDVNTNDVPDECEPYCDTKPVYEFARNWYPGVSCGDMVGTSVAMSHQVAVLGAPGKEYASIAYGAVLVYRFDGLEWGWDDLFYAVEPGQSHDYGDSVAVSEDVIVVGAPTGSYTAMGYAFAYRYEGDEWSDGVMLPTVTGGDRYGHSVAVSGEVIVVGAPFTPIGSPRGGAAHVYRFNGVDWVAESMLLPSDSTNNDEFGISVAVDVDVILIGAHTHDGPGPNCGAAYVYRFNGSDWVEEAKLTASDAVDFDNFGRAVALHGGTAVIGAPSSDHSGWSSGAAYVYRFNGVEWVEEATLLASDGKDWDWFGSAVDVEDDLALIGNDVGVAYVFRFDGDNWTQAAELASSNGNPGDDFGASVSISGGMAVVGAPRTDDDNPQYQSCDSGRGYFFVGMSDCNENDTLDACDMPDSVSGDCNNNGILDECDISEGTSADVNSNGIPDECELPPVALCRDFTVDADDNCEGHAAPEDVDYGSHDPEGDPLSLSLDPPGPYPLGDTEVTLTVTDDLGQTDSCTATITVVDTTPPTITCPTDVTVSCGEPTNPAETGTANATDNCDPAPTIGYSDVEVWPDCPADLVMKTIERTWTATDAYGNSNSCVQTITVLKLVLDLDIKPGSCPNSFNRNSHGVLPVGLLGTANFDVTAVDLGSVVLSRADCVGGIAALHESPPGPHTVISDVGTPFEGDPCACHEVEGDGIDDLSMKFKVDDLVPALELDSLSPGALVELVVTGTLADGCEFMASDCVRLVPPGTPPGALAVESNVAGAWVEVSPLDDTLDGGGFADFERFFPQSTVVTLTAETPIHGRSFRAWQIDGVLQTTGQTIVEVTIVEGLTARAVYRPRPLKDPALGEHDGWPAPFNR